MLEDERRDCRISLHQLTRHIRFRGRSLSSGAAETGYVTSVEANVEKLGTVVSYCLLSLGRLDNLSKQVNGEQAQLINIAVQGGKDIRFHCIPS